MKKLSLALLTIFTLNNIGGTLVFADALGGADKSEETACFEALTKAVKNSANFGNDLSNVKKTKSGSTPSSSFDVSTYKKFLKFANTPAPKYSSKVKYFPDQMKSPHVLKSQMGDEDRTYKANRTNIGTVMYKDESKTTITGPYGKSHKINGYFVDTKVVTFGEKNDWKFPLKARDPKSQNKYPYGAAYDDVREYMLYTHHLANRVESDRKKQFLSCGIVHIDPQGKYTHKTISNNSYKGNIFEGSNYQTKIVTKNGKKFRQGDVTIQTVDGKYKASEKNVTGSEFAHFDVITLAYDNKSKFLNEYETLELQKDAMANPADQTKGMPGVIQQFYDSIPSKFEVKSGVYISDENKIDEQASKFKNLQASSLSSDASERKGGLAMYDGVDFETIQAVEKIRDPSLRAYMRINLIPGYKEVYQQEKSENRSPFEQNYLDCDLTHEERIENVEYLLEKKATSGRPFNTRKLEYKDPKFGFCGIPFMDKRERAFLETSPLSNTLNKTILDEKKKLVNIDNKIAATSEIAQKKQLEKQKNQLTLDLQEKLKSVQKTQKEYRTCVRNKLFLESDLTNGKITRAQYNLKSTLDQQKCQYALKESASLGLSTEKVEEVLSYIKKPTKEVVEIADKIEENLPEDIKNAAPISGASESLQTKSALYKITGIVAFILAALLIAKLIFRKEKV